ncbi:hypothetical protein BN874_460086 [Candidatus Contendobacter odensis Run_B_J11]|uniref:Uncharacterized protein n=1 Tax=Candidatus Contendobacter odensis Run_B_J11 TaxID=1400861 RepID=A0A7U7GDM4_9GAMM|nr:hypothetical protein BN874_460086 [Candidatus Contendobacter odensis Run_B_J11]
METVALVIGSPSPSSEAGIRLHAIAFLNGLWWRPATKSSRRISGGVLGAPPGAPNSLPSLNIYHFPATGKSPA